MSTPSQVHYLPHLDKLNECHVQHIIRHIFTEMPQFIPLTTVRISCFYKMCEYISGENDAIS
jgi:hypothetical protein